MTSTSDGFRPAASHTWKRRETLSKSLSIQIIGWSQ
jgi:hypothetical protein